MIGIDSVNDSEQTTFSKYGPRNNVPPPSFPPMGVKPIPPLVNIPVQTEPPPGYRGRYDAPPFEDIPPGVEPPVPGFEPSPFEKPSFGPPGSLERDRIPPPNYRDPYRPPYVDGPAGYRDMSLPPIQNEIPVHVGDQPSRYRDSYRSGHLYRDQGPVPYRDGQPYRESGPQAPYRDGNFRGGPPPLFRDNSFRNVPYRDGNFRDNMPHNFREPGAPYRPPSADPREAIPPNFHDPNYRDGYREDGNPGRDHMRPNFRGNVRSRGGSRRNPNIEHDRHREREGRERERFNENRDPSDRAERPRDVEKRTVYDKREGRDERTREHDKNRDYDKERERGHEKVTPDKKIRTSPKRTRDAREKKRSESRGRSRERDRENRREKKEDRIRDKSSAERSRDHKDKDKEKKIKDRKKKKREKEKDNEKKKKRDKKEKKEKDIVKKDDENLEKCDESKGDSKEPEKDDSIKPITMSTNKVENHLPAETKNEAKSESIVEKPNDDLYGDEAAEAVDKEIIQNYVKTENNEESLTEKTVESSTKEEPFDGIELQARTEELEEDIEGTGLSKEVLAPLPELSKWEVEEDNIEKTKEPGEITSPEEEEESGKVTSEVIKRAENAIFAKAINSLRPIEIKKISSDRLKLYGDETQQKSALNNIQITVPVADSDQRSIELNERKRRYSKTPPPRLSVKERLGGKVEDIRRTREMRVVQSTVERVKSRSKTPKKEQMYRRVTVDRDRVRKPDSMNRIELSKAERRIASEDARGEESYRGSDYKKREFDKDNKNEKKPNAGEKFEMRSLSQDKNPNSEVKGTSVEIDRKKSILDEAHFEPDYDETVESDTEPKEEGNKKRERSVSPAELSDPKKLKLDETIKLDLTNVKKKKDTDSESSSDSDETSSSSSSDARRRKKKKKRNKKKKKRAASDSDSDSDSSSDDHKKKKKKRKHKKKSSKKKKKSKHK